MPFDSLSDSSATTIAVLSSLQSTREILYKCLYVIAFEIAKMRFLPCIFLLNYKGNSFLTELLLSTKVLVQIITVGSIEMAQHIYSTPFINRKMTMQS